MTSPDDAGREFEQSVAREVAAKHRLDPRGVGIRVREGVELGEFYIFTLPGSRVPIQRRAIEARTRQLLDALDAGIVPGEL